MKGIELPINILVIVAVAIIVLLGVVALFYSSWFQGTQPLSLDAAKSQACSSAARIPCGDTVPDNIDVNFDSDQDGDIDGDDSLMKLCENYYNIADSAGLTCLSRVCGMNCGET